VQVLLADMMVHPIHATLQYAKETLNSVCRDALARPFAFPA
jgi:hypothetical protein